MTATATTTREYVVTVEPEYVYPPEAREGQRKTITLPAEDTLRAALIALSALKGRNQKTLRSEHRPSGSPETARRYLSRADREGDRWLLTVDLSPAEKQRIADAKAADEAAYAAKVEAAKSDQETYQALVDANPDVAVSLGSGYVRVTWKVDLGDDYSRIEVTRDRGYGETGWTEPAEVSVGSARLKAPFVAARAKTLSRAVEKSAAIAALLDAKYPAGSPDRPIPEDANPIAASYRAHSALLALVVAEINS